VSHLVGSYEGTAAGAEIQPGGDESGLSGQS